MSMYWPGSKIAVLLRGPKKSTKTQNKHNKKHQFTKEQIKQAEGRLPDALIACIGGGSNAMGLFHPFLDHILFEQLNEGLLTFAAPVLGQSLARLDI